MNWTDRFKNRWRNFGIPNLMGYIVTTMFVVYFADLLLNLNIASFISLSRYQVMQGEIWRLITFIFVPPSSSVLWIIISLLFYYFMGSALENAWGKSTFTLYYILGIVGAVIAAMISGKADNSYLNLSLVLAFAQLFPDNEFRIYFLIPIKVKYLAYAQLIIYAILLIMFLFTGNWPSFAALIASLINFFIFFGPGLIGQLREKGNISRRRREYRRNIRGGNDDNDKY